MSKDYSEIKKCLCCYSSIEEVISLGDQPLANDFHRKGEITTAYPLNLMYCKKCFHCQLSRSVNPSILFKNYKYVSGTSDTGNKFFKENCDYIHTLKGKPGKILDIACNDGSQLNFFRDLGWDTYGVDPAENICPIAEKQGHKVFCDFWKPEIAKLLPKMDVITAQNVFAHTIYVDDFLDTCKMVMGENTSLFIQTSQRDMILNGEFDTIYHEHISFYNTTSMKTLVERHGLSLVKISEHSIHGRSYIFEIKLGPCVLSKNVEYTLKLEEDLGLYNKDTYCKFRMNTERSIKNLKSKIQEFKEKGFKIIGFGAAAKGQTLLCYGNVIVDYIIDENPLKIDLYSPKFNIPIVSLDHFKKDTHDNFLVIILAWNFAEEIKNKLSINKGSKNISIIEKYFPNIIMS
tara:strand:+ start:2751 stop:3959 length:1209 start_codon:yes stop_codon:yes gene_type:complete